MSRTSISSPRSLLASLVLMVGGIFLLQACGGGGGGGGGAPPAPNPTGYYINTGTLTVGTSAARTDLQAMINGTRFIMSSVQAGLVYDGTIAITGNSFTGTLSVFTNGISPSSTTVSGTFTQGTGITGTLTGTGAGSGTFSLNYTAASNQAASMTRVAETAGNPTWESFVGGSTSNYGFVLAVEGNTVNEVATLDGNFSACEFWAHTRSIPEDRFTPIPGTSLYSVRGKMILCNPNIDALSTNAGDYTGLAASRSDLATDDTLVMVVTSANGAFSMSGDFK